MLSGLLMRRSAWGVREKLGDLEGAKTSYQQAIDSGHTKWASKATLKLQGYERNRMTTSEQQQNQMYRKGLKGPERAIDRRIVDLIKTPLSASGIYCHFTQALALTQPR